MVKRTLTEQREYNTKSRKWKLLMQKWFFTIVGFVFAILPTLFWFFVKSVLAPDGFWQQFAVYGLGLFFLGGLQIVMLIMYLFLLATAIWD